MISGRALGIDFGTKRIGFAVSDEMGWAAEPLEVYTRRNLQRDFGHIAGLVRKLDIVRVVVGIPYRLDGSIGPSAERASSFVDALREALPSTPIETRDEALTSWEAEQRLEARGIKLHDKRRLLDAYAAAVILQDDLDERSASSSS